MITNRQRAIQVFNEASSNYPASITAQSAYISTKLLTDKKLVGEFSKLSNDKEALHLIKVAAEARHRNSHSFAPKIVETGQIKRLLEFEIKKVEQMRHLKLEDLTHILEMNPHDPYQEFEYANKIDYVYLYPLRGGERSGR